MSFQTRVSFSSYKHLDSHIEESHMGLDWENDDSIYFGVYCLFKCVF